MLAYLVFFDKSNARKGGVKDAKYFFFAAAVGIAIAKLPLGSKQQDLLITFFPASNRFFSRS